MSIGSTLKEYRKKNGFTLKKLSDISGVSLTFISDIENGRKKPSTKKAKQLADALNIDVKLLLDEKIAEMIDEIQDDVKISNPDIRAIIKACRNLTNDEISELRKFTERLFPNAF